MLANILFAFAALFCLHSLCEGALAGGQVSLLRHSLQGVCVCMCICACVRARTACKCVQAQLLVNSFARLAVKGIRYAI